MGGCACALEGRSGKRVDGGRQSCWRNGFVSGARVKEKGRRGMNGMVRVRGVGGELPLRSVHNLAWPLAGVFLGGASWTVRTDWKEATQNDGTGHERKSRRGRAMMSSWCQLRSAKRRIVDGRGAAAGFEACGKLQGRVHKTVSSWFTIGGPVACCPWRRDE